MLFVLNPHFVFLGEKKGGGKGGRRGGGKKE